MNLAGTAWRYGRLNWLQQNWLRGDPGDPTSAHENTLRYFVPTPDSRIHDVLKVLADVVGRHDSLRTVVTYDQAGVGFQTVHEPPRSVDDIDNVVELTHKDISHSIVQQREALAFNIRREWPVRFLVCHDGVRVCGVHIFIDHSATDGWGLRVLGRDILSGLSAGRYSPADLGDGEMITQPLDTVAWEDSSAGIMRSTVALKYWRERLQSISHSIDVGEPKTSPPPAATKSHIHELTSRRLRIAAEKAAARFAVSSEAIFLCVFGWALSLINKSAIMGIMGLHFNRLSEADMRSAALRFIGAPVAVSAPQREDLENLVRGVYAQRLRSISIGHASPNAIDAVIEETLPGAMHPNICGAMFNYAKWDSHPELLQLNDQPQTDAELDNVLLSDVTLSRGAPLMLNVRVDSGTVILRLMSSEGSEVSAQGASVVKYIADSVYWMASDGKWPTLPSLI